MVKVGRVYKSKDGNVDLTTLKWRVKLSLFISTMIDDSFILSGNKNKMESQRDELERRKVQEYTLAALHHLEVGQFKTEDEVPLTFDMEDIEFVKLALGGPQFFKYGKTFIPLEHNLQELQAYKLGIVVLRRLQL